MIYKNILQLVATNYQNSSMQVGASARQSWFMFCGRNDLSNCHLAFSENTRLHKSRLYAVLKLRAITS